MKSLPKNEVPKSSAHFFPRQRKAKKKEIIQFISRRRQNLTFWKIASGENKLKEKSSSAEQEQSDQPSTKGRVRAIGIGKQKRSYIEGRKEGMN